MINWMYPIAKRLEATTIVSNFGGAASAACPHRAEPC